LKQRYLCKITADNVKDHIQTGDKVRQNAKYRSIFEIIFRLEETSSDNAGQDNRNLCDDGSANQTLQHDEIEQLKSDGVSGQTIISQLVSKSATFEKKTLFSQQKYLNKKKKK
jgi:hypothetical protein